MKKLLLALLALAALAVAAAALLLPRAGSRSPVAQWVAGPPAHGRPTAPWKPYGYQCRPAPRTRSYNLPVLVQVADHPEPNVRLLLDMQDPANYYFVELTRARTRIGKVESGLEADLGTQGPRGLRLSAENKIVVKRRYSTISVVLNDSVVAHAEDESFHGGQTGAGVLDTSASVRFGTPQRCDPILFGDDFMKGAAEAGGWTTVSGTWQVAEIRNPSLSSNAFYYVGTAFGATPPAVSVCGQWFWDNYRLRAAVASFGTHDVGIFFYYRDPDNAYLLRWNADKQPDGTRGRRQLVKRWHGEETILAEEPGGYQPRVWYELEAQIVDGRIRALIDGHELFHVADPDLCFGKIGLYSAVPSPTAARFDDVVVQSVRAFDDDFATVAARRWRPLGGDWQQRQDPDGRRACLVTATTPAKAVAGSTRWRHYTASTILRLPATLAADSEVGLVAHYLDETNYALLAWRPASGTARLEAFVDGQRTAHQQVQAPQAPPGTGHLLELACRHGVLTATLDGQPLASAWAPGPPRGAVGLYAAAVDHLAFDSVRVHFPLPPEPVLTSHEVFSREHTMEIWAGAARDWEDTYETLDGQSLKPHWHRADFFGDATIEVELDGQTAKAATQATVPRACRLVLAATSTQSVASGYNLVLQWPKTPADPCQAILTRGKHAVAHKPLTPNGPPRRLRLRRAGPHLIASVNDKQVLAFTDPQPLTGCRAAYATTALPVPKERVSVFSDNVNVYTFRRASSDWRTAAGTWEVTNRWECDPRWSFFSGVPDSSRLAAIWNKYAFEGDVSVEFAVGPKMENARGGGNYRYARDFNVTICADGKHISSGYSFLFGGWNNARSAILRGGKLLATSSFVIPRSSGIHRRWFYVKVEKRGNTLNYWIDGSRILTTQDPQPLAGNRIAIWSWDCGLMIARVRISASRITDKEPPGTPSGPCHTVYTLNP